MSLSTAPVRPTVSALRLGTFLLRHRAHAPAAPVVEGYSRKLRVGGKSLLLERRIRGTRTELTPPVAIEVTETCPGDGFSWWSVNAAGDEVAGTFLRAAQDKKAVQ